ncbi:sensor histidine kinase [Pseudohaliea rubra]|uniref:histidine kinase n=1 Tax=Pseudohaliea rubra DSM 19751 TaxID=1265313 RepID=A0A095VUA1_9GAMM|nr:HAMP domain-containing sensor histidine kinase [Pseudohaliea rubra]KGE05027.1 Osmosensitive K+ channel histidine kinase KdpD [Pseudohaliea rubra DSM 19751]
MSLRRRLILSLLTILVLFAINVGTHFWGSFARSESMVAYRQAVEASQLTTELEQLLEDQRQQILVLATLRETTEDRLGDEEKSREQADLAAIRQRIENLGAVSRDVTQQQYERLLTAADRLLVNWQSFYERYNDPAYDADVEDAGDYLTTSQRLKELEQRQAFIAVQRANVIDRTILLTDRITVVGFITSIFLTATLGLLLVRYTNASLKRLKRGTERIGAGDLGYRIDDIEDEGELGDLAEAFNTMADKLRIAIEDEQQAKREADEANAAKSIFLANVSHELRTPLNAIIGYSEMLHDELGDAGAVDRDSHRADLDKIALSGRQLLALIDDILDLSKIETGKMELHCQDFRPEEVIRQVCDGLAPLVREKKNRLHLDLAEELPQLHSDATKFRQVLVNLLSNASKFTEDGDITVRARPAEAPYALAVAVVDTGIGMNRAQQARVFEAFVQAEPDTSAAYGGTGLGLAICRDFCELMGGRMSVTSAPGQGSTFTVELPADPGSARAGA